MYYVMVSITYRGLNLKEVIFNFLTKQSSPITFDQLMTALPEGQGQKSFGSARSNLIYWVGMSESMATALLELIGTLLNYESPYAVGQSKQTLRGIV